MRIGIDVSQLAFEKTGVSNYLENLLLSLVKNKNYEFILFYSSMRRKIPDSIKKILNSNSNVILKNYKFPPFILDILWNKLHKIPIENFIGKVDFFITSDWTEPPVKKARKATILYDLMVYKYPKETAKKIVDVQKNKLYWVKKESDIVFCISDSTRKDALEILKLDKEKTKVLYPGLTV